MGISSGCGKVRQNTHNEETVLRELFERAGDSVKLKDIGSALKRCFGHSQKVDNIFELVTHSISATR